MKKDRSVIGIFGWLAQGEHARQGKGWTPKRWSWWALFSITSLLTFVLSLLFGLSWQIPFECEYMFSDGAEISAAEWFGYMHLFVVHPDKTRVGIYAHMSPPIPVGLSFPIRSYPIPLKKYHLQYPFWHPRGFMGLGFTRGWNNGPNQKSLTAPGWFVIFIPLALAIWSFRHARWHPPEGRCPVCKYDLRASSGRCPECGTVLFAAKGGGT
jgi:hypothetical protein